MGKKRVQVFLEDDLYEEVLTQSALYRHIHGRAKYDGSWYIRNAVKDRIQRETGKIVGDGIPVGIKKK